MLNSISRKNKFKQEWNKWCLNKPLQKAEKIINGHIRLNKKNIR